MSAPTPPVHRRALVTGASSGIGAATARLLAQSGYRVALLARRRERLAELALELERAGAPPVLILECDLRSPAAVQAACDELAREFGALELLVNNAGMGYRATLGELDPELLRALFETNVFAPFLLCQGCLPLLARGDAPVVVNVASVVGRRGIPGQAAYAASKAALVSLGEALRVEWAAAGIAVCTLNPALTATGFFEATANPAELAAPDLTRAAGPAEVAREVLELARHPRPERSLRWKWRLLAILSVLTPRLSDRLLVRRLGGSWRVPRR